MQRYGNMVWWTVILFVTVSNTVNLSSELDSQLGLSFLPPSSPDLTNKRDRRREDPALSKRQDTFVIFYHIFIPPDGAKNALRIIEDQLKQVGESYAASHPRMSNQTVTVYYTTVGGTSCPFDDSWMTHLCQRLRHPLECRHVQHFTRAFEEATLQHLHWYCQDNPSSKVVYIHSKGSYTQRPSNEGWRKHMTKAVTDERCLRPENETCNVCGLIFFANPAFMFRGNMWTAKCDYVGRLHVPGKIWEEYLQKVYDVAHEYYNKSRLNLLIQAHVSKFKRASFGLDRYSNEHWIGAHPSLVPCDLSGGQLDMPRTWQRWNGHFSNMTFTMAPSRPIHDKWEWQNRKEVRQATRHHHIGYRAFFLLPGRIIQWQMFYNSTPPHDAWVWSWFPDGLMWREAVNRYGLKAFETVSDNLLHRGTTSNVL